MYQIETIESITEEYLSNTIREFAAEQRQMYLDNIEYSEGRNPKILERKVPDSSGPDNRVPVSYARRIINLVVGYMYKPGLINYGFEDDTYGNTLQEVMLANAEPLKSAQIGKQTSIHGVGYEYHYVAEDRITRGVVPRFVKLPAPEVIPIYNKLIEPEPVAFLRVMNAPDDKYKVMYVTDREIQYFLIGRKGGNISWLTEPVPHFYGRVPLAIYRNNEELMGDFEPAEPLIDAYDVLVSDSLNEFGRSAWAYLLLKGMSLDQADASEVNRKRAFENLEEITDVGFLTKQIDTEFIKYMTDLIRAEIHRQTGIPNIEDYDGAGASGKTLTKFIYMMELFLDPKESYFKEGLTKRLELVNQILKIQGKGGDPQSVDIIMNRNAPDNSLEQAEIFNAYSGHISKRKLIENFADFVDDPEEEIAQLEQEGPIFDIETSEEEDDMQISPDEPVQNTALNGAQIKSLLDIIMQVATGVITKDTADALIGAAFPGITEEAITDMLTDIKRVSITGNE